MHPLVTEIDHGPDFSVEMSLCLTTIKITQKQKYDDPEGSNWK